MLNGRQDVLSPRLSLSPCLSFPLFRPSLGPRSSPPGPYKNHISWMWVAATAFGDMCGAEGP